MVPFLLPGPLDAADVLVDKVDDAVRLVSRSVLLYEPVHRCDLDCQF